MEGKNKTRTAEWRERRGGQVSRYGKLQGPVCSKEDPYKKPVCGKKAAGHSTRGPNEIFNEGKHRELGKSEVRKWRG